VQEPGLGRSESVRALNGAILRIFGSHGGPVGAGILITDKLAFTCTHVVATALGLPASDEPAAFSRIEMDLPLLPGSVPVTASVERFLPAQGPGAGDVAVLRLDVAVPGARPVRLLETDKRDVWGHRVRTFGFPAGRPDGEWHHAILRARQGSGWVQADLADVNGYRVAAGFSGAPVWDDAMGGVVGMMVAAEADGPAVSYLIPADGLLAAVPELRTQVLAASPFRGLAAFRETDTPVFYGRDAESDQLVTKVTAGVWTTLVGPSGCGKSSLVMAGVLPRLRARGYCPVVIRPSTGSSPLAALADALLSLLEPELSELQRLEHLSVLTNRLAEPGQLADICVRVSARHGGTCLLIVVDQFEELFARQAADVDAIAGVLFAGDVPDGVRVLVTLRADFMEVALANPLLRSAFNRPAEILRPMSPEQLWESIIKPVETVPGVDYQPGLADRILSDAGTNPGALPLLAFMLDMLWHGQHGGELTHVAYDALGGVRGALKTHIDREWKQYVKTGEYDEAAVRSLLTKLVRVPIGSAAATRRTALRTEMSEGEWRIVQHLAASRLLVTGHSPDGVETVELAHEAVIAAWNELAAWVQADRAFLEWRESLRHDVSRWERGNHDPDLLPSPATLAGSDGREHELNEAERDYIKQGHARRRARARRRRSLIGALSTLILIAASVGTVSIREQRAAAEKAASVQSSTLAADSQDLAADQPGLAAQLAVAAYRTSPTEDATSALYAALQSPLLDNTLTTAASGAVARVATQADGPLGAAMDDSGTVRVWNLGRPTAPILASTLRTAYTTGIALAPRAPLLATSCATPGLCLWNLTDPAHPAIEARLPTPASFHGNGKIDSMAVSPDGTLLAAASETGYSLLWSIAEPAHPRLLAELPNPSKTPGYLAFVAFSPAGGLLAESTKGGATRLYSLSDPANPTSLATINAGYQDIAINPAGTMLAGANDTNVGVWDISRPNAPTQISYNAPDGSPDVYSLNDVYQALSFSPDGRTLAFGGAPNATESNAALCLLNVTSLAQNPHDTYPTCMSIGFSTLTMAYTDSGALLTGGVDGAVRLWHTSPEVIANANGYFLSNPLAVSADGRFMVAAIAQTGNQVNSPMGIWNLDAPAGPALLATFPQSSAGNYAMFLDPDVVLSGAADGDAQLWNVADPRHPRQTATLDEPDLGSAGYSAVPNGYDITFDPTRSILADGVGSGVLELWHVTANGTATLLGSLTDSAADSGEGGVLATGDTAFMLTSTGIDWWNISDPAHPVKTGSSPLDGANLDTSQSSSAATLYAASPTIEVAVVGATLNLYNLDNGHVQSMVTVSRHSGGIPVLSPDGHLLADYSTIGNELTIWNTTNPRTPKLASSVITVANITGITFSANGDFMADWNPQTVQLWDTHDPGSPVLMGTFSPVAFSQGTNSSENIDEVNFAVNGKLLVTVQSGEVDPGPSVVYALATDPKQATDQLCSITTNPITVTQWEKYAPGAPYQNPC
jgi:WD40 repeat protein